MKWQLGWMVCGLTLVFNAGANCVYASTSHQVEVKLVDSVEPGANVVDSDVVSTSAEKSSEISEDIFTGIASGFDYRASAAVGRFGNLGVSAEQFVDGRITTRVDIVNRNEIINNTGLDQSARANFIIDGGEVVLQAAPGDSIEIDLLLTSSVSGGGDFRIWEHRSSITAIDFANVMYSSFGSTSGSDDIGAFVDPSDPSRVDIPFSFQTFDLGVIPAGAVVDLTYSLTIESFLSSAPEQARWKFSDPLDVSGFGAFPAVTFVPEPSSLVMVFGLLGVLGGFSRRQSKLGSQRFRISASDS